MGNFVTTLAAKTFLNGPSSLLLVTRTIIKNLYKFDFPPDSDYAFSCSCMSKNQCLHFFSLAIDPIRFNSQMTRNCKIYYMYSLGYLFFVLCFDNRYGHKLNFI